MSQGIRLEDPPPEFILPPPPSLPEYLHKFQNSTCRTNMFSDVELLHLSSYLIIGCIFLLAIFSAAACSLRCFTKRKIYDDQKDHLLEDCHEYCIEEDQDILSERESHYSMTLDNIWAGEKFEMSDNGGEGRDGCNSNSPDCRRSYMESARQKLSQTHKAAGQLFWIMSNDKRSSVIDLSHES